MVWADKVGLKILVAVFERYGLASCLADAGVILRVVICLLRLQLESQMLVKRVQGIMLSAILETKHVHPVARANGSEQPWLSSAFGKTNTKKEGRKNMNTNDSIGDRFYHSLEASIETYGILRASEWTVFCDEKEKLYIAPIVYRSEKDGKKITTEYRLYLDTAQILPDPRGRRGYRWHQAILKLQDSIPVEI